MVCSRRFWLAIQVGVQRLVPTCGLALSGEVVDSPDRVPVGGATPKRLPGAVAAPMSAQVSVEPGSALALVGACKDGQMWKCGVFCELNYWCRATPPPPPPFACGRDKGVVCTRCSNDCIMNVLVVRSFPNRQFQRTRMGESGWQDSNQYPQNTIPSLKSQEKTRSSPGITQTTPTIALARALLSQRGRGG